MSILGDNTAGTGSIGGNGDRALVTLFTAPDTGADGTMYARFNAASTAGSSVKGLIFANNSGTPGTLLASTAAAAVPAGGGQVTLGTVTVSLTASTTYFVGIVWDSFESNLVMDEGLSAMDTEMMNGTYVSYTTPGNWGTTDISYTTTRVNVWLDYAAAGAASPFPPWPQRIYQLGR